MKIEKDRMVALSFELKNDEGMTLDASSATNPVSYLHGGGTLVPGFEKHLEGMAAGDEFEVTVPPKDGFGERVEGRSFEIPRHELAGLQPTVGMTLNMQTPEGGLPVTVCKVKPNSVVLDQNHPFAGQNLHFKGKVLEVREANKDELRGCCGHCDVD